MPEWEWSEDVRPEWIDYNGHLSEAYYVLVFGHASDAGMVAPGISPEYLVATRTSLFTLEAHVRYLDQIAPDAHLTVRSSVIGVTGKLLWIWHEMWCDDRLRATEEVLGVHVVGRSSAPFPDEVAARARAALVVPP